MDKQVDSPHLGIAGLAQIGQRHIKLRLHMGKVHQLQLASGSSVDGAAQQLQQINVFTEHLVGKAFRDQVEAAT